MVMFNDILGALIDLEDEEGEEDVCVCDDDTLLELCLTTAACQRVFLLFSSFF